MNANTQLDKQILILGNYQMFGEQEVIENKQVREYSVKCNSQKGILYVIDRNVLPTFN